MILKLKIPLHLYLSGPTEQSLEVATSFEHDDVKVNLGLTGEKLLSFPEGSDDSKFFRRVKNAEFELQDTDLQQSKLVKIVTTEPDYVSILKFLLPIVNRVLRCIRNWGFVESVAEINPPDDEAKKYIAKWDVRFSEDGEKWQTVVKPETDLHDLLLLLALFPSSEETGTLHVRNWPDIEEAVQDNLESPPEQEFFTNSIEHLNRRNYRLALVEAIICLEIVLTQFLRVYLSINKKLSKKRIDAFLSKEFGLMSKVSGLLDLVLDPDDLKKINIDNVRTAINWRNGIIHKTGHLPRVPEEELRKRVADVLTLADLLGRKRDQIHSSPELQQIGNQLSQKFGLPGPTILRLGKHRILIDFDFLLSSEIPSDLETVLESVAKEASFIFATKDPRFSAAEHLHVRFLVFFQGVKARWRNNKVEVVK